MRHGFRVNRSFVVTFRKEDDDHKMRANTVDQMTDLIMENLLDIEDGDDSISDADVSVDLTRSLVTVGLVVLDADEHYANDVAGSAIRTALEKSGVFGTEFLQSARPAEVQLA